MAANSNTIKGVASLQKRFANHTPPLSAAFRRKTHTSVYDKNVDEHVRPALVPDDIIHQKSEYWAPHPHTGVFGPAGGASSAGGAHSPAANAGGGSESVLEQKTFFRAMENLDKPQHP